MPTVDCTVDSVDAIAKPADTESITYTKDAAGITATLNDGFSWGDLGAYDELSTTTAILPAADLAALLQSLTCETEPTPSPSPSPTESVPAPVASPSPSASPTPSSTSTPSASPSAPAAAQPPTLAQTGATVGGAVLLALLLAGGGFALVWARRRIRNV
ncbi:hypothetical protein [Antribacter gilvus]|uniref:hypothetical protein n=1 Tax=Antribacter gilvus TaxID=2304675 RepID=UPI000F77103C|nr:hypothetical protein [Antribacter gilvus]